MGGCFGSVSLLGFGESSLDFLLPVEFHLLAVCDLRDVSRGEPILEDHRVQVYSRDGRLGFHSELLVVCHSLNAHSEVKHYVIGSPCTVF